MMSVCVGVLRRTLAEKCNFLATCAANKRLQHPPPRVAVGARSLAPLADWGGEALSKRGGSPAACRAEAHPALAPADHTCEARVMAVGAAGAEAMGRALLAAAGTGDQAEVERLLDGGAAVNWTAPVSVVPHWRAWARHGGSLQVP